jgi:hypothetical protein
MTGTEATIEVSMRPRTIQMRSMIVAYPLIMRMHVWRARMSRLIAEVLLWWTGGLLHRAPHVFDCVQEVYCEQFQGPGHGPGCARRRAAPHAAAAHYHVACREHRSPSTQEPKPLAKTPPELRPISSFHALPLITKRSTSEHLFPCPRPISATWY